VKIPKKQFLSILLIAVSMTAMADRAQDKAEIRTVINQINAAYTKQDAEAMAPLLAEDFETWDGIKGRENVSEAWANENVHYRQLEELGIRFITDEVAIFRERGEAWDVANNDRSAPQKRQYIESWVLVRRNGKWVPTAFFYHRVEEKL
jgi:uncharacterized protein (TIGR02246 family)